jgi:hypothetical protein
LLPLRLLPLIGASITISAGSAIPAPAGGGEGAAGAHECRYFILAYLATSMPAGIHGGGYTRNRQDAGPPAAEASTLRRCGGLASDARGGEFPAACHRRRRSRSSRNPVVDQKISALAYSDFFCDRSDM